MRLSIVILAVLMLFTLSGCGSVTAQLTPTDKLQFIENNETGAIYFDPLTVKVSNDVINAQLHLVRKEVYRDLKTTVFHVFTNPSERKQMTSLYVFYDEKGKELGTEKSSEWNYYNPGSEAERIAQALLSYCRQKNIAVKTTSPPYADPGFLYIGRSEDRNLVFFFTPYSIKVDGDTITSQARINYETVEKGVKYELFYVNFKPATRKVQVLATKAYNIRGGEEAAAPAGDWQDIPPESVLEKHLSMLLNYCRQHNIPVPN